MASIDELLSEVSQPDSTFLEFYKSNMSVLETIWLNEIHLVKLYEMALRLHSTMNTEAAWMAFLNKLGIEHNLDIIEIKLQSELSKELPIYLALSGPLQHNKRFSDVIKVLIEQGRHDVLKDIKLLTEDLIEGKKNKVPGLYFFPVPSAPCFEDGVKTEKNISHVNTTENKIECKFEDNFMQQSEAVHIIDPIHDKFDTRIGKSNESIPLTVSNATSIKVFIPHAEVDSNEAARLSNLLMEEQIIVKTLEDLDHLFAIDSSETTISLLNCVDFVVPVVSEAFMKQIHPSTSRHAISSDDDSFSNDSSNRHMYQLLLNDYLLHKCLNFRVRPVLVPNMKRKLLIYDALLFNSLLLWKDVPKLVKILRKTKEKFF